MSFLFFKWFFQSMRRITRYTDICKVSRGKKLQVNWPPTLAWKDIGISQELLKKWASGSSQNQKKPNDTQVVALF